MTPVRQNHDEHHQFLRNGVHLHQDETRNAYMNDNRAKCWSAVLKVKVTRWILFENGISTYASPELRFVSAPHMMRLLQEGFSKPLIKGAANLLHIGLECALDIEQVYVLQNCDVLLLR
ncbi:uncharacterized protein PADG_03861 [Paracoccidioides brasiliensis Pb18]|uniref:Uncharacterized protein n=1 Tax=Paracoccidioides brasiliensis (strain Pb18) TaxID=502780 RepID=C1G9C5_PARBD|nr:uncharacterized protein PADG_03861 [Paracoccidioides brasiliensis Pb18]EEH47777.1 hypothetical protein PADG_03861 [Paracoccidioides brasiliensis Pb18]